MMHWIMENWDSIITIFGALLIAPILMIGTKVIKN